MKSKAILMAITILVSVLALVPIASAQAEIAVIVVDSTQDLYPNETTNYTVLVLNTGDEGANITMSVSGVPTGWLVVFNETQFYLDASDRKTLTLSVTLPASAEEGEEATFTIQAVADRGTSDTTSFSTTIRAAITVEYPIYYWSLDPIVVSTADIATIPITIIADASKIGSVLILTPSPALNWDSYFTEPWICTDAFDPDGSEITNETDIYGVHFQYTIPSEASEIYIGVSPLINAVPDSESTVSCNWKEEGAPTAIIIGNLVQYAKVGEQNYSIQFVSIDTTSKEVAAGGFADYSFAIENIGSATCDLLFEIIISPYVDTAPNWTKDWSASIGSYSTPGDPDTFLTIGNSANTILNTSGYASYEGLPEGLDTTADGTQLIVRVSVPTNATPTDNASTLLKATVAQSSKPRAETEWFAGNLLNESGNSTGVGTELITNIWFWVVILIIIVAAAIVAYYIFYRNKKKKMCEKKRLSKKEKELCGK